MPDVVNEYELQSCGGEFRVSASMAPEHNSRIGSCMSDMICDVFVDGIRVPNVVEIRWEYDHDNLSFSSHGFGYPVRQQVTGYVVSLLTNRESHPVPGLVYEEQVTSDGGVGCRYVTYRGEISFTFNDGGEYRVINAISV
jgi:hypothetical protein